MQAIVYDRYGNADAMRIADVATPEPGPGQVRIRVVAAAINSWDWDLLHGITFIRMESPLRPNKRILGCDVAGRVEAVGDGVTRLAVGEEVFGDISAAGWGGFAERVCTDEEALCRKPAGMGFLEAAALPQAGVLALQGLRLCGEMGPGRQLLIIGAGGGVGTFALQLAKQAGSQVTVVDDASKLERLRQLGADAVLDYRTEDFVSTGPYDFILDVVGRQSPRRCLRALTPDGRCIWVGATPGYLVQLLALIPLLRWTSRRRLALLLHKPQRADLEQLSSMVECGELKPVIDRVCSLAEVPGEIERLGRGDVFGKVVAAVSEAIVNIRPPQSTTSESSE
ncbi:MAG: NAD(P)-dependent alcohol dehydrogenase [Myxococcales bacterium]|nr:NAD(P)-dependent alcohol dehydrogenase [Myxococcales bacterium]